MTEEARFQRLSLLFAIISLIAGLVGYMAYHVSAGQTAPATKVEPAWMSWDIPPRQEPQAPVGSAATVGDAENITPDAAWLTLRDRSRDDATRNEAMNLLQGDPSFHLELIDESMRIAGDEVENERMRSYAVQRLGTAWEWSGGARAMDIGNFLSRALEAPLASVRREAAWGLASDPRNRWLGFVRRFVESTLSDRLSADHDLALRIAAERSWTDLAQLVSELADSTNDEEVRNEARKVLRLLATDSNGAMQ